MMDINEAENDFLFELVQFYTSGSWEKVVDNATKLRQQYPLFINLLNILGSAYLKLGDPCQGISQFKLGLLVQPAITEIYISLTRTKQHLGQLDGASRSNQYGLVLQPNNPQLTFSKVI